MALFRAGNHEGHMSKVPSPWQDGPAESTLLAAGADKHRPAGSGTLPRQRPRTAALMEHDGQ